MAQNLLTAGEFPNILTTMKPIAQQVLEEIEAFLEEYRDEFTATSFGIAIRNDGHLVRDLKSGASIRSTTIDAVRAFIRSHRQKAKRRAA